MATGITVVGVVLSRFALDGGAMHGIIPRPLWEKTHAADAQHRIRLVARAVVVDHPRAGTRTLVELGLGTRWSDKERDRYAIAPGPDARGALAAAGIDPDTITHVVLTHLHWDHAGGLLAEDGSLAFPRAKILVSEGAAAHARAPTAKDDGSFRRDVLDALFGHPRLELVRPSDAGEIAPGISARSSEGHTPGLLIPMVRERDDGPPLAVPTDLVPTRTHCRPSWIAAYDVMPAVSADEKTRLYEELAPIGGALVFYHDPDVAAARVSRAPDGQFAFSFCGLEGGSVPSSPTRAEKTA